MPRLLDQNERKERKTKQQEEARSARAEYRNQQLDIRERTARLRALRLAGQTDRKGGAQRNPEGESESPFAATRFARRP